MIARISILVAIFAFLPESHQWCFPVGCEFGNNVYANTSLLEHSCFRLLCKTMPHFQNEYYWYTNNHISPECSNCTVWNDPHYKSFDKSKRFDFHGSCRYSLAQHVPDWDNIDHHTDYGVFADYKNCEKKNRRASCVNMTSIKLDPDHTIHVFHDDLKTLHDETFSHEWTPTHGITDLPMPIRIDNVHYPALMWMHHGCLRVEAVNFGVELCANRITVFAHRILHGRVGGLCGKFNGRAKDDHTARDGTTFPFRRKIHVGSWASTWMTEEQYKPFCHYGEDVGVEGRVCSREELSNYARMALTLADGEEQNHQIQMIIAATANDVCNFPDDRDVWLDVAREVITTELEDEHEMDPDIPLGELVEQLEEAPDPSVAERERRVMARLEAVHHAQQLLEERRRRAQELAQDRKKRRRKLQQENMTSDEKRRKKEEKERRQNQ